MPSEHLGDEVLGAHRALLQPFFVASNFAEGDHVKVLLPDGFGYHAAYAFLVHFLGEHGLFDAAVEAAKIEPHSWQAAKLRSVSGARGGVS